MLYSKHGPWPALSVWTAAMQRSQRYANSLRAETAARREKTDFITATIVAVIIGASISSALSYYFPWGIIPLYFR